VSSVPTAFFQQRVAAFGLLVGSLGLLFLVFRVGLLLSIGALRQLDDPSLVLHAVGVAFPFATWAACRGRARSRAFVGGAEAVALVGSSLSYAAMGLFIPPILRPDFTVLLALALGLMGRAVYVPSTALRTLTLSVIIGAPLPVGEYFLFRDAPPAMVSAVSRLFGPLQADEFATNAAVEMALWWLLVTILATAASSVVYGLRREVSQARRLGQYVLEEKLGEGGMGVVFRAGHAMLRRPTAVKLLPPERSSERDVLRFEREVQLTARLTHPNTVTVFDYGRTVEGVFYYAMELLDGASLDQAVAESGSFPPERVIHVLHQVAGALTEAHGIGLIHRDLKPANIMLCERGGVPDVPKVLDFGLVKELGRDSSLSIADALKGTPLYMSPEAIRSPESVGPAADLYALGAVAYFLLTGEPVFPGATMVEICAAHLHSAPVPPSRRSPARTVPADLEALVLACLEKEADRRPASAADLQKRLETCGDHGRWTRERAAEWWREHGPSLRSRRSVEPSPTAWTTVSTLGRSGPGLT
jgi:serine/threonine-protein kinase